MLYRWESKPCLSEKILNRLESSRLWVEASYIQVRYTRGGSSWRVGPEQRPKMEIGCS